MKALNLFCVLLLFLGFSCSSNEEIENPKPTTSKDASPKKEMSADEIAKRTSDFLRPYRSAQPEISQPKPADKEEEVEEKPIPLDLLKEWWEAACQLCSGYGSKSIPNERLYIISQKLASAIGFTISESSKNEDNLPGD